MIKWRDAQTEQHKPETVNSQLRVLRALFSDATAELGLPSDPTARVQGVRAQKTRENPNRLTAEELQRLLAAIERLELQAITQRHRTRRKRGMAAQSEADLRRLYPLFLFLAHTGVRIGEATALRWDDVDLDRMVVTVHRARWRAHVDSTKTDNLRTIPLTTALVDALHAHRARLEAVESVDVLSAGWLFPSLRTGGLLSRSVLDKPLRKALDAAGIPRHLTVHGFRRTFNNLLRQAVRGDIVRAMTGHVTERMTLHYSHIEGEEKAAAIALVFERPRCLAGDSIEIVSESQPEDEKAMLALPETIGAQAPEAQPASSQKAPSCRELARSAAARTSECNLASQSKCGTSCGTLPEN